MCISIPLEVKQIIENRAMVKMGAVERQIDLSLLPGIAAGDYILSYAGVAIRKVSSGDASEILNALSDRDSGSTVNQILSKNELGRGEIRQLLAIEDEGEIQRLFKRADFSRRVGVKDQVCVHGAIEFSNHCKNDCAYCGLRAPNRKLTRYRMSPPEIVRTAVKAVRERGFKMLILQSGEDFWYTDEVIADIISQIKTKVKVLLFLSIGERGYEAYKRFREAGAKGVLFRFETSDSDLYRRLHGTLRYQDRQEHLKFLKELGYLVASGPLIGLPGQTLDSLTEDILLLRKAKVNMASMGPFIPHPDTPLAGEVGGSAELTLKMIAVTRLALSPNLRVPISTALETVGNNDLRIRALNMGANSLMLNLTPLKYRRFYDLYPGRFGVALGIEELISNTRQGVKSIGRRVCKGWGSNFKLQEKADKFLPVCN